MVCEKLLFSPAIFRWSNRPIFLNDGSPALIFSGLECRHALDTAVSWKCRHWRVDDCIVADLAARIPLYIWQVCSRNSLEWVSRVGSRLAVRSILEIGRNRHSIVDLWAWLLRRILVSQ